MSHYIWMHFTENRGLSRCQISRYWGHRRLLPRQPAEPSVTPKSASLQLAALNVTHPCLTSTLFDLIFVGKRGHSSHAQWNYSVLILITCNTLWYLQEWLTYYLVSSEIIWIGNDYVAVAEKNWNICIYSLLIYTGIYNINLIGTLKQCVVYRLRQKYSLRNSR